MDSNNLKKQIAAIKSKVGLGGRTNEEGQHKAPFYGRSVKGGGMNIKQLVTPSHVISYSHNKSASNGDVGRKIKFQDRKSTNL